MRAAAVLKLLNESSTDLKSALSFLREEIYTDMSEDFAGMLIVWAKGLMKRIESGEVTGNNWLALAHKSGGRMLGQELIDPTPDMPNGSFTMMGFGGKPKMKDDYEEVALKIGQKQAHEILSEFESKVIRKLQKVGARLGEPEVEILSHSHAQGRFEAEMSFEFGEASFRVKTQIVTTVQGSGSWYTRFPLTFHDVILSDGTKMRSPSEAKMAAEFK